MKKSAKRLLGVVFTLALMTILACGAFAAKPAIEIMVTRVKTDSVGGVSPSIGYRNNSDKTIKYIDFTMVPYNAVGDTVSCEIRGNSAATGRVTGPIDTFAIDTDSTLHTITKIGMKDSNPFKTYRELTHNYTINDGKNSIWPVYVDQYGNCFVEDLWTDTSQGQTYLTDDEVQNATYGRTDSWDRLWYNNSIKGITVTKAVVTYMDGSKQTLSQEELYSGHFQTQLTYQPYFKMLESYSPVYDYAYYKTNNPDLAALFGDNQWKYLEHFVNSGMKEGRQGNSKFNLDAYKANNADLVSSFGEDNQKYYEHYISSGKSEGRKAS